MTTVTERGDQAWLDFIVDMSKQLDQGVQAAFLKVFLLHFVNLEASEQESVDHWEKVLARQNHLTQRMGRPVTLRTAAVDYFEEVRSPGSPMVMMEYGEIRRLRHNAGTDPLTGMNNRRIFEEELNREINRCARQGSIFSLLLLDLRKFKSVNDTYGHAAGDDILRGVARSCQEVLRASDSYSRTGGDEFAILLPGAERPSAESLAERIAKKFQEHANIVAPNTAVAIDYGIAVFPEDGQNAVKLFDFADKALYTNKHGAHVGRPTQPQDSAEVDAPAAAPEPPAISKSVNQVPTATVGVAADFVDNSDSSPANGRKHERIGLEGTPALGMVRVGGKSSTVRIMNISNGGVCLMMGESDLPDSFSARLQVPMVPANELTLHRVYSIPLPKGRRRVGCSFTPPAGRFLV